MQVLSDNTGSRRFLCVEVKDKIDCTCIEHKQIYAQLKQELSDGARYWFSAEEEEELKSTTVIFQHRNPAEEVLRSCFRPATSEDPKEKIRNLSATDIFKELKKQNPAAMREATRTVFRSSSCPPVFCESTDAMEISIR